VVATLSLAGLVHPAPLSAQPIRYMATTLAALDAYPSFFHRRPVVVRATPEGDLQDVFIGDGDRRVRALHVAPPIADERDILEIEGTFWDVGRLQPNDPRVADHGIAALSERLLAKPWPSSGELRILIADDTRRAEEPDSSTIRTIALEPARYRDRTVTVTGRFRARNLFGDLPEAPGNTRDDFVLQSGDASIWIVGKEPKGDGFDFDVMGRLDTNRWLQVTGVVSGGDRLTTLEAENLAAVERPAPTAARREAPRPEQLLPAEVIFSAPTQGDNGVALDALVRFQFSRDMAPDSFTGNVRSVYVGAAAAGNAAGDGTLELTVEYRPRNRVLNVQLAEPLLPYRPVAVTLGDGIEAVDGAALLPHTLQFATGGS
jgi:hypothetical protein